MPINIPETLPAYRVLRDEGVMVMSTERASRQDIRPLNIGLLNLMPEKIKTETQFARLIGSTPFADQPDAVVHELAQVENDLGRAYESLLRNRLRK